MRDRDRLLALLRRHGWNATSFQAVETGFSYWFDADGDAAVAYLDTGGAWVVAGSPIAALDRVAEVAERFAAAARLEHRRVVYFAVEPRFLRVAPMPSVAIGQQPSWNPSAWSERHRGHRSLKEQLRRARAKGVVIERVDPGLACADMKPELERLIARWLGSRAMPPMSFLVALEPFVLPEERRYYIASVGDATVGLLVAVPVYGRRGWFFEDLLRDPSAPNGTTELLIDFAMHDVAAEGCEFVTLGLVPLAGDAPWLRAARTVMRGFYNFEGLRAFKSKLRPDEWTPIFAAWPQGRTPVVAIYDALEAFAGGHVVRFALLAVLRAPAPALTTLGALAIPWTIALVTLDTKRWFPSRRVQLAWGVFDLAMSAALFSLGRKWRRPVAIAAAAAATADVTLTSIQAVRYNIPRARGWRDALVIAASIAAPLAVAAVLIGGFRTRQP